MIQVTCKEWETIQMGCFDEQSLYRHFMFLGETGSGKTVSGIMPLCRTAFDPNGPFREFRSAGLVVDPKGELAGKLEALLGAEAGERLIRLNSHSVGPVLWLFEQFPSLEELGASGIVEKMMCFASSYQAQIEKHNDAFWINSARQILVALVGLDLTLWCNSNGLKAENVRDFWDTFGALLYLEFKTPPNKQLQTIEAADGDADMEVQDDCPCSQFETYESLNKRVKAALLNESLTEDLAREIREYARNDTRPLISYQRNNYISHIGRAIELSQLGMHDDVSDYWDCFIRFLRSWQLKGENVFDLADTLPFSRLKAYPGNTYGCIAGEFGSILADYLFREFYKRISVNPFEPPKEMLSTRDVIEHGQIVVYEPGIVTMVTSTIGKVLKSGFFKALIVPERLNNSAARPFFYICDEFHNFITEDPESGEQSFLDRCRAYRVCCGLATQSVSSLLQVLDHHSGLHAVNILLVNTGTKMFFRNTDRFTTETLHCLIESPAVEGKPHIVQVRPPSTMLAGECYYILVSGKSGRGRVKQVVESESVMTPAMSQVTLPKTVEPVRKSGKKKPGLQIELCAKPLHERAE